MAERKLNSFRNSSLIRSRAILSVALGVLLSAFTLQPLIAIDDAEPKQGRSLAEFKKYVSTRVSNASEAQLDAMAKQVDKDGDGRISEAEFKARMVAFRRVFQSARPQASDAPATKPADRKAKPTTKPEAKLSGRSFKGPSKASVLLITGKTLAAAWKPFAEWKTRIGKSTSILTVAEIEKSYAAESIQEKIRLCVRDHIDHHGTRWVILGGDCLPDGTGIVPGGHKTVHTQERAGIPTDIVYISATDWDADGDGIYGEFKDDREAISYPDGSVGLGRIPVRTAEDVAAFTEKVIAYESNYPTTDFATQMIYTCTDSPAYPKVRKSWDGFVSKAWKEGQAARFFSQETPWDEEGKPGSYPLSAGNLVSLFNKKTTGKLHIHGHGHLPAWVLERSVFTADHVGKLNNEGAYPLITTVSCNTGEYDSSKDPSIVEAMIRAPKAGSVAIVAPVRTGKAHFHSPRDFRLMVTQGKLDGTTQTMTRYWAHGLGSGMTTGEALMKSKADMKADAEKTPGYHLCISELNLLGDPTLDMRASAPRLPTLKTPKTLTVGQQVLEFDTKAPGSTVCLWKSDEVYALVVADSNGMARAEIATKSPGDLHVSISGRGLNAATAVVSVQSK